MGSALLTEFLEAAGAAGVNSSPLLRSLARRQVGSATWFLRQLPAGGDIVYDGEDREWLLSLTEEAQRSIEAISFTTMDGGTRGFDGGMWVSDLGTRYLDRQREAIGRNVTIRRIFVFEHEELARDDSFLKVAQLQREVGVDVRMLYFQLIPEWLQWMVSDFAGPSVTRRHCGPQWPGHLACELRSQRCRRGSAAWRSSSGSFGKPRARIPRRKAYLDDRCRP